MDARQKAGVLMQCLVYPAVLGACLVAFCQYSGTIVDNHLFPLGLLLLAYFATLFVETEEERIRSAAPSYSWPSFTIDVIEVTLIFCLFVALGPIALRTPWGFETYLPHPVSVCVMLVLVFLLPAILRFWKHRCNQSSEKKDWFLDGLCLSAASVCVWSGIRSYLDVGFNLATFKWNQYSPDWGGRAIAALWVLFVVYVGYLLIGRPAKTDSYESHWKTLAIVAATLFLAWWLVW